MPKQNLAVTTDCAVFCDTAQGKKILLVQRKKDPFAGQWALPGGFLEDEEPLETGAKRELKEETGLTIQTVKQLRTFGTPGRDPRGRTISISFWGEVSSEVQVEGNDDAADAKWFRIDELPSLAFDHDLIVKEAIDRYLSQKS